MMPPKELSDPAKLEAAIEELQAERERRVTARIEAGEAIRYELRGVVVHDHENAATVIGAAKERKIAELRRAGEHREVIFDDPVVIQTGVPRARSGWIVHGEVDASPGPAIELIDSKVEPDAPPRVDETESSMSSEPRRIVVQVEWPGGLHPEGVIVEGEYSISNGTVYVRDAAGNSIGSAPLTGQHPDIIARRILRAKWQPDFYRPLH
jgi:hypothetical protein